MTKIFGVSLFIAVVLGIYFLINWYVLGRFAALLGIRRGLPFFAVVIVATMSLVVAMSIYASHSNWAITIFYRAATMWMGISFLFFWCHLLFHIISKFYPIAPRAIALAVLIIVSVLTLYTVFNAMTLRVNKIQLSAPVNLKIAMISDVHIGSVSKAFITRIVDQVNALKPDVVLMVGDIFDNHNSQASVAALEFNRLALPVFMSAGNHEGYVGYDNVESMLEPTKIRWLRNESIEFAGVHLIGINNTFHEFQIANLLNSIPGNGYTILMNHQPVGFDIAALKGVDLMLSGHTHAGQIWPFKYITHGVYKYLEGLYRIDTSILYVSPGTGTWGPRMRLGTHSEITIIQLQAK